VTTPLLEVESLDAGYGPSDVLHGVSFTVGEGGITTVLGANGAGKTTLLRAVCGLIRRRGRVRFGGAAIDTKATEDIVRLGLAHVPDGRGTFVQLSAEENLRVGAITRRDRKAVAGDMERMYGYFPRLRERRHQQAGTLSGGEQQMVAIGRALMSRPKLICMDEPSMGLSPLFVEQVFDIIQMINRQGVTMFMVEQNAAMALSIAHRAYVLQTGVVVLSGTAAEMRENEMIKQAYLGEMQVEAG
jgi:branched-chain amino acid transport system ATP-binding protein